MTDTNDDLDMSYDLEITKTTRRAAGAGTWVSGTLSGHRFDALVFPEHADNPEWEIGDSRISKLFIQRLADKRTVFNWDRGADVLYLSIDERCHLERLMTVLGEIKNAGVTDDQASKIDAVVGTLAQVLKI